MGDACSQSPILQVGAAFPSSSAGAWTPRSDLRVSSTARQNRLCPCLCWPSLPPERGVSQQTRSCALPTDIARQLLVIKSIQRGSELARGQAPSKGPPGSLLSLTRGLILALREIHAPEFSCVCNLCPNWKRSKKPSHCGVKGHGRTRAEGLGRLGRQWPLLLGAPPGFQTRLATVGALLEQETEGLRPCRRRVE